MKDVQTIMRQWSHGIRLYASLIIGFVTVFMWGITHSLYGNASTAAIRLQESYAWAAVVCLLVALLIGPVFKSFRRLPGRQLWFEARRIIGIGAAWFATLHVLIAYIDQFKLANPLSLPATYQRAFLVGFVALAILLVMAATSFNAAMRYLGVWWFRLHRLVYPAALLVLLHAFLIGVHAVNWLFLIPLTAVGTLLLLFYIYHSFVKPQQPTLLQISVVSCGLFISLAVFNYGFTEKLGYNPIIGKNHSHEGAYNEAR